jgi:hypothetical protein
MFAKPHDVGGMFGLELALFPYSMEKSGRSWLNEGPVRGFGGAIGWTMYRGSNHSFGVTFGPIYSEARVLVPISRGIGMTRFGSSAPAEVAMEKFGFTVSNVVQCAKEVLKK